MTNIKFAVLGDKSEQERSTKQEKLVLKRANLLEWCDQAITTMEEFENAVAV